MSNDNNDPATIKSLKGMLVTIHVARQGERIRARINDLEGKGLSADQILKALKKNPPVLTPVM